MPPLAGLLKAKLVDAAAHDAATSNLNLTSARGISQAELLAAFLRKDGGAGASGSAAPASGGWTASTSPTGGVTAYGDTGSAPRKRRKVKLVPQKQT